MDYNLIEGLVLAFALGGYLFVGTVAFSVIIRVNYEPLINWKGLMVATFVWPVLLLFVLKRKFWNGREQE